MNNNNSKGLSLFWLDLGRGFMASAFGSFGYFASHVSAQAGVMANMAWLGLGLATFQILMALALVAYNRNQDQDRHDSAQERQDRNRGPGASQYKGRVRSGQHWRHAQGGRS